jgi:hypothetical protein
MSSPRLRLAVFLAAFAGAALTAQESRPETQGPRRDQEAVDLLKKHDDASYIPSLEGLKDFTASLTLPAGIVVDFKWKAPDKTGWSARPAADVPEDVAKRLRLRIATPTFRAEIGAQAPSFLTTLLGKSESARFAKDGLEALGENRVRIVAAAPETLAVMREAVAHFGADGLMTKLVVTSPLGDVSEMTSVYEKSIKGKSVVKSMTTTLTRPGRKPHVMTVDNDYVEVGGYVFVKTLTMKNSLQGDVKLDFSDHKVDVGLKDEDFDS